MVRGRFCWRGLCDFCFVSLRAGLITQPFFTQTGSQTTAGGVDLSALHDDFREAALDTRSSYRAVCLFVTALALGMSDAGELMN